MSKSLISENDFQTVQSVNNGVATVRSTNPNSPSNSDLLSDFQEVDSIPKIETDGSFFDENNLPEISSLAALLKELGELFVRFDTTPVNYNKGDFEHLVKTITNTQIHLYKKDQYQGDGIFVDFVGIGDFTTNPAEEAITRKKYFPGIYLLNKVGVYSNFGLSVTEAEVANSVIMAIPKIENSAFVRYEKIIYKLTLDLGALNVTFADNFIANPAFGKYTKGMTVPAKNKNSNDVLLDAFSSYINPEISSFTGALSTLIECGSTISGLIPFYLTYNYLSNVKANSLQINNVSQGNILIEGNSLTSPIIVNIGTQKKYASGESVSWRAAILNTKDEYIESPPYSITWRNKVFYGSSNTPISNSSEIRSLSST